jgi:CxxC motif-containing protein (DUF1111 family)
VRGLDEAGGPGVVPQGAPELADATGQDLLHDMGSLGDGIEQGQATGREMRTAPLWGLRLLTTFLHDGRARTIEDAILAHDGQGRAARRRFAALRASEKAALMAFLRTL